MQRLARAALLARFGNALSEIPGSGILLSSLGSSKHGAALLSIRCSTTSTTDEDGSLSRSQMEVNSALRQMGYTTQLEAPSADGLRRHDILITALPNGTPCSIALEFDGRSHSVGGHDGNGNGTPMDRLDGPTRQRNKLLGARFPDSGVCIPWKEWVAGREAGQQEKYLRNKFKGL